jgi:hypothetical protein
MDEFVELNAVAQAELVRGGEVRPVEAALTIQLTEVLWKVPVRSLTISSSIQPPGPSASQRTNARGGASSKTGDNHGPPRPVPPALPRYRTLALIVRSDRVGSRPQPSAASVQITCRE